jgi:hypothetical protein
LVYFVLGEGEERKKGYVRECLGIHTTDVDGEKFGVPEWPEKERRRILTAKSTKIVAIDEALCNPITPSWSSRIYAI